LPILGKPSFPHTPSKDVAKANLSTLKNISKINAFQERGKKSN